MQNLQKITNRFLIFLMVFLFSIILYFLIFIPISTRAAAKKVASAQLATKVSYMSQTVFGTSGLGKQLIYNRIASGPTVKRNILMTYEVHGFEDLEGYHRSAEVKHPKCDRIKERMTGCLKCANMTKNLKRKRSNCPTRL
ncbi:MAG: hypothetical protein ABF904_09080, partial [Ethanoligenens sp.]